MSASLGGDPVPHVCINNFICHSFNMITSVVNLLVIACDRYISVAKALSYQKIFSKRRIVSIIIGCWVVAIFMTVVPLSWSLSLYISDETKGLINVCYASAMFAMTIIAGSCANYIIIFHIFVSQTLYFAIKFPNFVIRALLFVQRFHYFCL